MSPLPQTKKMNKTKCSTQAAQVNYSIPVDVTPASKSLTSAASCSSLSNMPATHMTQRPVFFFFPLPESVSACVAVLTCSYYCFYMCVCALPDLAAPYCTVLFLPGHRGDCAPAEMEKMSLGVCFGQLPNSCLFNP